MRARRMIGAGFVVSAILAAFLLPAFGVPLGYVTIFDASVGDHTFVTEKNYQPNWPSFPAGVGLFVGIALLVWPARRAPGGP